MVRVHVLDDERLVRGTVAIGGRHDQCCRVVLFDHGFPFVRIGLLFEMDMRLMMSDSVQEGRWDISFIGPGRSAKPKR